MIITIAVSSSPPRDWPSYVEPEYIISRLNVFRYSMPEGAGCSLTVVRRGETYSLSTVWHMFILGCSVHNGCGALNG
jgi:hypothetical protein